MKNEKLLFLNNKETIKGYKPDIKNSCIQVNFKKKVIGGREIMELIRIINTIEERYASTKIPIVLKLGELKFADKLTIVIFETICHYILTVRKRKIGLSYTIIKWEIWTEGIFSSPLLLLGGSEEKKFIEKYNSEIYKRHYRRVVLVDEKKDPVLLSKIVTEINSFLKIVDVAEKYRDNIALVISELVGNACEHTKTECLIDIDVTTPYGKENEEGDFYGINIVVLNFSPQLLGNAIEMKINERDIDYFEKNPRYEMVLKAKQNHEILFNEWYQLEDFYNICSFQHKISGRKDVKSTGGTGLTKLIQTLEKMSDAHKCYVVAGKKVVNFLHDFLEYDSDKWIGFNKENSFENNIPDRMVIDECGIYFPGTAYNLNFAMKKE